jgi:hypothetical protein
LKPKPSTAQLRIVTPSANPQSSARPKVEKKKNDGVASTKSRRPISPTSTTQSAHVRSHAASPERSHGHSAHSRSHVRAASPEITLREEVKKLKRILLERDDWLREKEAELLEAEDIIDALQERVREVEARNRELQRENEIMRNHIEEENEKKKSTSNEPAQIINSVMNNIQRIRGELATPTSKPNSPSTSSVSSPMSSPKTTPVLTTSKSKELLKANNNLSKVQNDSICPSLRPHVVPQTRGNLIPANKVNNQKNNDLHPPRCTAPSPAAMNRHENINGGFTEMLDRRSEMTRDRQASALDRKQAAALNAVMEESEDSDADEFKFETDDNNSDDQADSESDDRTESESDDDSSSVSPSGVNTENEDYDDEEEDDSVDKWSTHASSKYDLDSIVEEEDEDDDDEFDYDETQQMARQKQKNWNSYNPASPMKNSQNFITGHTGNSNNNNGNKSLNDHLYNNRLDSISSSDSGIGSAHEETFDSNVQNVLDSNNKGQFGKIVNNGQSVYSSSLSQQLSGNNKSTQQQRSQKRIHQDYDYPHRDSMSSIKSDSSEDSAISVLSSQNGSYPSSITSPSSTGSFTKSTNDLYGQSSADSSSIKPNKFSSPKLDASKFDKNGLNDNYPTSVSTSSNNNSSNFNNGFSDSVKNSNKYDIDSTSVSNSSSGSSVNSKRSPPNLVSKQFNPRSKSPTSASIRPISPASSSRASTPSSNASTARASSPAYHSSSRASTPASESSRNASGNRATPIDNPSEKCSTAIPPPPPPPVNKDPFATLQHYLRLISENSVMENPLKSYDIKKVIDEGSSAKVFTAHPMSNPSEECAIKVVPLSYSLEFIFNEIYVLKNLKHKNIVDFKESFLRWDGKTREVWIAMEKCARGDVTSRAGKVNQRETARIARDVSKSNYLFLNDIMKLNDI